MPAVSARRIAAIAILLPLVWDATAAGAAGQGAVAPLMRLLKSGRLPPERLPNIVEMVCKRGEADDLQYIYEQAVAPDGFSGKLRLTALEGLAAAAETRKVRPAGELEQVAELLDGEPEVQLAAVRLCGAWKLEKLAGRLREIALSQESPDELVRAALDALVSMGEAAARPAIEPLLQTQQPIARRLQAVASLARLDLDDAASHAATILETSAEADPTALIAAFIGQQGGSDRLAEALAKRPPPADVAKLSLRAIYALGRSDPELVEVLSAAAGIHTNPQPLTAEEIQALSAEVAAMGDPARGEDVFRRNDLNCVKCHSLSGAGGNIGPDLSAVGSTSPIDYVINSLLVPDLAIKEAFVTRIVTTLDGDIYQGIVLTRDETRLVLKDATGQSITIPIADIDEEVEGHSLMPKGITSFLTHQEFLDLVRFVSELGKPGPYAVRSVPTIQRWRLLIEAPEGAAQAASADVAAIRALADDATAWQAVYAKVAGGLPLAELAAPGREVLWLRAEIDVTVPGAVQLEPSGAKGIDFWIDGESLNPQPASARSDAQVSGNQALVSGHLARGVHEVLLRLQAAQAAGELRVVVAKAAGSPVEFTVVGGP